MVSGISPGNHCEEPGVTRLPPFVADLGHHASTNVTLIAGLLLAGTPAVAQQVALSQSPEQCARGRACFRADQLDGAVRRRRLAVRYRDGMPHVGLASRPDDKATWSGACQGGLKHGKWRHAMDRAWPADRPVRGQLPLWPARGLWPIRLEQGPSLRGQLCRQRAGRPWHGALAGETLTGHWNNGCLTVGGRVVAIGVPRTSCMAGEDRPVRSAQQ